LTLTVGSAAAKGIKLGATNVTVAAGSSGTSTVTITPQNGYTGTIAWTVTPAITNACFTLPNTTVSGTSAVTATLTVFTSSTACSSAAVTGGSGKRKTAGKTPIAFRNDGQPTSGLSPVQAGFGLAGLLLAGLVGFRSRKLGAFAGIFLLAAMGFALSGCSSGGSSGSSGSTTPTETNAPAGTYTVTITGTDTTTSSITAATTLTLTID